MLDNRAIMFVGQDEIIQTKVINGFNAAISSGNIAEINIGQVPSLSGFDGKQLAVASANGRVVVAWTNQQPSAGGPIGGVAVLRCE
ncbi:MAG: hypothetical protein EOO75_16865 [Myxococcales bacterium]|nr:MAG: hypothetical protein EOO75_16865 [Myxococcales bacterium]